VNIVSLGEIVDIKGGGTPDKANPKYWNGDIPWASVKDFKSSALNRTADSITLEGVKNSASNIIPAGAIIVPTRMAVGKAAISSIDLAINQDLKALFPRKSVDTRYLLHVLLASSDYLERYATGATVKGITLDVLKGLKVPLPPLPEQRRIAGILDQADALRRLRRQSLSRLADLGQAMFYEMFGDIAANPKGWPIGTIRDLLAEAKYGTAEKANTNGRGLPILRMGNLTYHGKLDLTDLKHVDLSVKDYPKYTTKRGDLLFNRTNSKELVGKTAVVNFDGPMAIAGYLIRARTNKRGNPHYISAYLNSAHGKAVLRNMCKNIVGMANINAQELQDIVIAMPPVELQNAFASKLDIIAEREKIFNSGIEQADSLFASLQHRAFRGEL